MTFILTSSKVRFRLRTKRDQDLNVLTVCFLTTLRRGGEVMVGEEGEEDLIFYVIARLKLS